MFLQNKRQLVSWLLLPLVIVLLYFISIHVQLSHSIAGKGIIYPNKEWILARNSDGNLLISLKDNVTNSISHYTVTEFQRGDHSEFTLNEKIFDGNHALKGDTIGFIYSNIEKSRLIEYEGELKVQQKLLQYYSTGEKPEEVQAAYERMQLALQEYETQKKITERNHSLYDRNYIADEEYEVSLNQYQVKLQNYNIARSEYQAITTGSKPEQLSYIMARIDALKAQKEHLEQLLNSFTITTPISGKIIRQQGRLTDYDIIVKIADTTEFMLIIPVDIHQLAYVSAEQVIDLKHPSIKKPITARVSGFDNSIQMLHQRQKIFVNARIDADKSGIYPNMQVDISINTGKVNLKEYITRFFNEVYNN